jgi:hypothetical protein
MFLPAIAVTAAPEAYFRAFLNQPVDVALLEVILLIGWIPIAAILLEGVMEIWKDYRQIVFQDRLQYCILAVDVPRMTEQSPKAAENIFASLQGSYSNILWKEQWFDGKVQPRYSFEIASIDGYIQYYIRCEKRHRDLVEAGIYAQYPDAQIAEVEDYAQMVPGRFPDQEWDMWGTEFAFKKEQHFPLRTWPAFEHGLSQELKDPLAVLLEQMSRMRQGECFFFQIVLSPCKQDDWKKDGTKFIKKIYGLKDDTATSAGLLGGLAALPGGVVEELTGVGLNSLLGISSGEKPKEEDVWRAFKITLQEKAQVEAVLNKLSKLGFLAKVRVVYFAKKGVYSKGMRVPMVKGFFSPFTNPGINEYGMFNPQIPKNDYFFQRWTYTHRQTRVAQAYKKRSFSLGATPKVLCTEELATLWHFPAITIKAPLVKKTEARRAEPPVTLPIAGEEVPLYRAAPVVVVKKETPPTGLPSEAALAAGPLEPEIKLTPPTGEFLSPRRVKKDSGKKSIPEARRVLLDPDVELEDVNIAPFEGEKEQAAENESAPPNLPL